MMSSCPAEWSDPSTRYRCEHPDTTYQDPLFDVPVTSYRTNITYRNRHCAMCHRDLDAATTDAWVVYFWCGNPRLNVSDDEIISHMSYYTASKLWVLNMITYREVLKRCNSWPSGILYSCAVEVFPTELAQTVLRTCNRRILDTCPDDWTDDYVRAQCEEYTAHVCLGDTVYRNYHCGVCNNNGCFYGSKCSEISNWIAPGNKWSGPECGRSNVGWPPKEIPNDFTLLLNWQRRRDACQQETEQYDPFKQTCRKSFTERNSKCKIA
jgi:hypothetical protein